jgi:hypothetical protein
MFILWFYWNRTEFSSYLFEWFCFRRMLYIFRFLQLSECVVASITWFSQMGSIILFVGKFYCQWDDRAIPNEFIHNFWSDASKSVHNTGQWSFRIQESISTVFSRSLQVFRASDQGKNLFMCYFKFVYRTNCRMNISLENIHHQRPSE